MKNWRRFYPLPSSGFGWFVRHRHGKFHLDFNSEDQRLLTESEVQRSFRKLFGNTDFGEEEIEKAEVLLEQLRPESPLQHRLHGELDELRKLVASST